MRNIVWGLGNALATQGFHLLLIVLLGNVLTPEAVGVFSAAMLAVLYLLSLLVPKFGTALVQRIHDCSAENSAASYFMTGLAATSLSVIFIGALTWGFRGAVVHLFHLPSDSELVASIPPLLILMSLRVYFEECLDAQLRQRAKAMVNATAGLVPVLLLLGLQAAGRLSPVTALLAFGTGQGLAVLAMGTLCCQLYHFDLSAVAKRPLVEMGRFTLWTHLATAALFLDQTIDIFLVNHFLGKADLAVYTYVARLAMLFVLLGSSVNRVTYPELVRLWSHSELERLQALCRAAINGVYMVLSLAALGLILYAHQCIGLVLPAAYQPMAEPLAVLLPAVVLLGCFTAIGSVFSAIRSPETGAWVTWITFGLNAILSWLLIPRYGLPGAAVSTGISYLVRALANLWLLERRLASGLSYGRLTAAWALLIAITAAAYWTGIVSGHPITKGCIWLGYAAVTALLLRAPLRETGFRALLGFGEKPSRKPDPGDA